MSSDGPFLDAAASIGREIVEDAVWQDGRCSWMGALRDTDRPWRAEYRGLEANVYDGTAGVGLFLAQLAAATGDAAVRDAAAGAIRHALACVPSVPPDRRDGFHAGMLGVAWAAARAAELLADDELGTLARPIPETAAPTSVADRRPDIGAGRAGAILALLALADQLGDPALIETAMATGDELVTAAAITGNGWSWSMPGRARRHPLCGLSHGAAGIGWALLELWAVTAEDRFAVAARGAFEYEHRWLDERAGTWPDLRLGGQRRSGQQRIPSPAVGTWCHGEAGIALTRLRAVALLDDETFARDAETALETSRRQLADALSDGIRDLSLCHGAAGAADVLLTAADALGGRWTDAAKLAPALGDLTLERYAARRGTWPCGAAAGTTPGLFRGLSGIGWWFLRLHDPTLASPLTMPVWPLTSPVGRA